MGRAVGQIILEKCGINNGVQGYSYSAVGKYDFFLKDFAKKGSNPKFGVKMIGRRFRLITSPVFEWLWEKAIKEFDPRNG